MAVNTYILKIGGVDLTEYICYGGMTVTETPVYDETETTEQMYADAENTVLFTAVSGKKIYDTQTGAPPSSDTPARRLKGKSVSISATAENVPSDVAAALFTAVDGAKDDNSIAIEYAAPALNTADFEYPTITSEISVETEDETRYDIKISANCPLVRFDGA